MRRYIGFIAFAVMMVLSLWFSLGEKGQKHPAAPPATQQQQAPPPVPTAQPKPDSRPAEKPVQKASVPATETGFDYYVLSLSWSPSYCLSNEGAGNRQQCGGNRDLSLVVHGFWPQFVDGYPQFCGSSEPDRVPDELARRQLDLLPSVGLIGHQWRKHGTCSSLSQRDYFAKLRAAWTQLRLPADLADSSRQKTLSTDQIVSELTSANPGLTTTAIDVTCDGQRLDEIRICMNKDLSYRECSGENRRVCRRDRLVLPAAP